MAIPVLGFKSKKDCKAAIRAEVDPHRDTGKEFYSELVARLFAERHYALSKHGIKPKGFRWSVDPFYNTPDYFLIKIEDERFPDVWWRNASWNKCIHGWQLIDETLDAELAEHYRRFITPIVLRYRDSRFATCEFDGCSERYGLDVHHIEPEFKTIAAEASALLTPEERASLIASHDWFSNDPWKLPHKCIEHVRYRHMTAKLMLVCKSHHYEMTRQQRNGIKP